MLDGLQARGLDSGLQGSDPALRAAAHMSLGNVHHLTGNHLVAIAHQRRAGQLFRRARHVAGEAAAAVGRQHSETENFRQVLAVFRVAADRAPGPVR